VKRVFDLVLALPVLLFALPVLAITAVLIALDSPGPVLYRSPRIGRNGKEFGMVRFRTVDIHKSEHLGMEGRLTLVGRTIRNLSIDDLPNLLNVLVGDMSFVGPRPTEPERVDREDPAWQRILSVRPGMFSLAILRLGRDYNASDLLLKQQLEMEYVENASLRFDLQVLFKGISAHIASGGNVKVRGRPDPRLERGDP
jgi:lipopolysaccharide/colanic/teichoic acid biosynthesis glycosyltransferase